jgi:hypothetical protein
MCVVDIYLSLLISHTPDPYATPGTVVSAAMLRASAAFDYRVATPRSRIHWNFPHQGVYVCMCVCVCVCGRGEKTHCCCACERESVCMRVSKCVLSGAYSYVLLLIQSTFRTCGLFLEAWTC